MHKRLRVIYSLLINRFSENTLISNLMKKSVRWEPRCPMQTDRHDEATSRLSQVLRTRLKKNELRSFVGCSVVHVFAARMREMFKPASRAQSSLHWLEVYTEANSHPARGWSCSVLCVLCLRNSRYKFGLVSAKKICYLSHITAVPDLLNVLL